MPPFFVVTTEATRIAGDDDAAASAALAGEIERAVDRLAPGDGWLAVRSSAVGEDSAELSFAGQLDSFLFVPRSELLDAIRAVWRSASSDRVAGYRAQHGLDGGFTGVGVIVQRMVDADVSGVAFGIDPVTGDRDAVVVSAVYGLGEGLVGGLLDADTYTVRGELVASRLAHKTERIVFDRASGRRTAREAVPEDLRDAPALTHGQVAAIAAATRSLSRLFGRPQDVEWCTADGHLHILQSRPVTGIAKIPADRGGQRILWDNSNIIESYAGMTTPLTFSFVSDVYTEVYREFCRILGVDEETIDRNRATFLMLGFIQGRIYYNLLNWYRMLALLPGYTLNARFMEQMMGVSERLEETPSVVPSRRNPWLRLGSSVVGLLRNVVTLRSQIEEFQAHLDRTLAPYEGRDLSELAPRELVATYWTLESELLRRWRVPILNDFYTMIFFGLMKKSVESSRADESGTLHNDLLSGEGGIVSTEPPRRLRAIAEEIRRHPDLAATFLGADPVAAMKELPKYPAADELVRAYIARFGSRYPGELKLETVTPTERPELVVEMIAPFLRASGERAAGGSDRIRSAAERKVRRAIRSPFRRAIFDIVLRNARERVRNRENLRFERTRVFSVVRRIFIALGGHLHREAIIDDPRDVFMLTKEEIFAWIDGTATTVDLRGLVALRRAEQERFASERPADRFETFGMVHLGNAFRDERASTLPAPGADAVRGTPCGPGVVRAVARRVVDPANAPSLEGAILVAERTDPGWVPLFVAARGLLVERGSLLSHSAIVAREMGIPAVVGIPGLMDWIVDGELVEMDGATGIVRKVSE